MAAPRRYGDAELLAGLRDAAAAMGEPLTVGKYDSHRAAHPELASRIWIIRHFKSWVAACEQAGVQANKPRERSSKWTEEDMLAQVRTYLTDAGSTGAYDDYQRWSAEVEGAPSGPALRARFGKWNDIKDRALGSEHS